MEWITQRTAGSFSFALDCHAGLPLARTAILCSFASFALPTTTSKSWNAFMSTDSSPWDSIHDFASCAGERTARRARRR